MIKKRDIYLEAAEPPAVSVAKKQLNNKRYHMKVKPDTKAQSSRKRVKNWIKSYEESLYDE